MRSQPLFRDRRPLADPVFLVVLAIGLLAVSACATTSATTPAAAVDMSMSPPSPDPRVGLRPGWMDAEEASWNMTLVSNTPPAEGFVGVTNSDLAFTGNYVIQGNYNGYQVWDISIARALTQVVVSVPGIAERCLGLQEPALRVR
jgi:hypothetical protein